MQETNCHIPFQKKSYVPFIVLLVHSWSKQQPFLVLLRPFLTSICLSTQAQSDITSTIGGYPTAQEIYDLLDVLLEQQAHVAECIKKSNHFLQQIVPRRKRMLELEQQHNVSLIWHAPNEEMEGETCGTLEEAAAWLAGNDEDELLPDDLAYEVVERELLLTEAKMHRSSWLLEVLSRERRMLDETGFRVRAWAIPMDGVS